MIVAIQRRRGQSMGDAIDDILSGDAPPNPYTSLADAAPADSDAVSAALNHDAQPTTIFSTSASSRPPVQGGAQTTEGNNSSTWSWSSIGQTFVAGLTQGLFKPTAATPVKPVSSGISTPVVIGGAVALVGLVLLLRRQSS